MFEFSKEEHNAFCRGLTEEERKIALDKISTGLKKLTELGESPERHALIRRFSVDLCSLMQYTRGLALVTFFITTTFSGQNGLTLKRYLDSFGEMDWDQNLMVVSKVIELMVEFRRGDK